MKCEASDRIVPQTQVLTGPDRLVIDFPNAAPSSELRSQSVDRGEVKDLRIGLFQSKPPVTRLVLDLKSAQSYQVFPSGRTVMIKVMGGGRRRFCRGRELSFAAGDGALAWWPPITRRARSRSGLHLLNEPLLDVTYRNGLLGIRANKATLSEVLFAVQQRTGADVSIAAGAEQEKVVADIAPGPAPEVLARLLNGSKFNFLILSAVDNPQRLDRVILSARPDGAFMPLAPVQVQNADDSEDREPPVTNLQPGNRPLRLRRFRSRRMEMRRATRTRRTNKLVWLRIPEEKRRQDPSREA